MRYFKPNEFYDFSTMNAITMQVLDENRHFAGTYFKITGSNEKENHLPNSQHYKNKAIDGYFYRINNGEVEILPLLEQYLLISRFNWHGVGLYPNDGRPYIHVDTRTQEYLHAPRHMWIGINKGSGIEYFDFSYDNFVKYIIGG